MSGTFQHILSTDNFIW